MFLFMTGILPAFSGTQSNSFEHLPSEHQNTIFLVCVSNILVFRQLYLFLFANYRTHIFYSATQPRGKSAQQIHANIRRMLKILTSSAVHRAGLFVRCDEIITI